MGDDNGDGAVLLLGNGLGLHARLNLPVDDVLYKASNVLLGKLLGLIEGELGVLSNILNGESWEFLRVKVKVSSVGSESLGINGRETDDAFMLLCKWSERFGKLSTFFGGLGEDVCQGDTSLQQWSQR